MVLFLNNIFDGVCITAGGNILASGNISLKLFMAPLETIDLLMFRGLASLCANIGFQLLV